MYSKKTMGREGDALMKIHGLQKVTLLDFPGRVACTVFLGGCDLRCPFCHNSGLLSASAPAELDEEALLAFLKKRRGLLDGVAFTGGEPLLRPELPALLEQVKALGYAVKLDTNGFHPRALEAVIRAGLVDYAAMDIKNSLSRYGETCGLAQVDLEAVKESAALLLAGETDYEFRTTAVAEFHDDRSFAEIGRWIRGARRYAIQCFTDRETVLRPGLHAPEKEALRRWAEMVRPYVEEVLLRGVD